MRCTALGVVAVTALAGNAFAEPAEQGCSYAVTPLSVSVSGAGGTGQIQVSTGAGCAWTASTAAGWLAVSPGNGVGSGTTTWTAAANTLSTQRFSSLTVAGRTVFVAQGQRTTTTFEPGAPRQLAASVSGSTVTLTWGPPESGGAPTQYVVAAGSASGWSNLAHFATGSTLTTFTAIDVPAGLYFVRVSAQNAAGTSPPSNEVTLTVGPSCTVAPPSALQYTVSGSLVTLTWAPAASGVAPASYLVEAGTSVALTDIGTFNTGWPATFAAYAPPGTYFVRLRATAPCGVSSPTTDVVIVMPP